MTDKIDIILRRIQVADEQGAFSAGNKAAGQLEQETVDQVGFYFEHVRQALYNTDWAIGITGGGDSFRLIRKSQLVNRLYDIAAELTEASTGTDASQIAAIAGRLDDAFAAICDAMEIGSIPFDYMRILLDALGPWHRVGRSYRKRSA